MNGILISGSSKHKRQPAVELVALLGEVLEDLQDWLDSAEGEPTLPHHEDFVGDYGELKVTVYEILPDRPTLIIPPGYVPPEPITHVSEGLQKDTSLLPYIPEEPSPQLPDHSGLNCNCVKVEMDPPLKDRFYSDLFNGPLGWPQGGLGYDG